MALIMSAEDREKLSRPDVHQAWFGKFDFPDGMRYWHNGVGSIVIDGNNYVGVSDPVRGQLVSIDMLEEPAFGQAVAVNLVLSGASREFVAAVKSSAVDIEGRAASIYWAAFDAERNTKPLTQLVPLFPFGRMSAPSINWKGLGKVYVSLTVESIWAAMNFPPGGRWSNAGQQARYPGDLGFEFVDEKVDEVWQ